jgi:hypothetical protein
VTNPASKLVPRLTASQISSLITSTGNALRTSIQSDISGVQSLVNGFVDTINKIPLVPKVTAPQIPVPSLDALQNLTLPHEFTDALTSLNSSLPTFQEIKDKVDAL